ncbi:MAG: cupredoxin family copper-binding protein [Acetobacteraceae bacterium]|nr:cupredoxin family copper-binding protein [Acetobacteraceae bacterium]
MIRCSLLARTLFTGGLLIGAMPARADETKVTIDNFTFSPPEITVTAGTRVTWTNRDDIPHTVTQSGTPRLMRSPPLDTGDTFDFTFDKPGEYRYFCSLHPHMQGVVVVVQEAPGKQS